MMQRGGWWRALTALLLCAAGGAGADDRIAPWMLADWVNPAPHFAELGVRPAELASALGQRVIVLPYPERSIDLPGPDGARHFTGVKFVSAVARVDLPVATLRHRLHDFSDYKHLFPMLTQSDVLATEGRNQVARYRVELPLPALATIGVDFRIKHRSEADGSISAMLIDGRAQLLLAMMGGMSEELANQPALSRWEFLPLDAGHSLLVFTYWDRMELQSFIARKLMEDYPELRVAGPYVVATGALEAIHRLYIDPGHVAATGPSAWGGLGRLQDMIRKLSRNGYVALLEPEPTPVPGSPQLLRYASVVCRIRAPLVQSRLLATQYARLPEVMKELHRIDVDDHGRQVDLGMNLAFGFLLIHFSLDLGVHNTWVSPERLEFRRTTGQLAQLDGASEWHAIDGSNDTLMLVSAAHELGDDAPLILRMAHRIVERIPYIDPLAGMLVELVALERLQPWIESNAGSGRLVRR